MSFLALDTSGVVCVLALAEDNGAGAGGSACLKANARCPVRLLGEVDGLPDTQWPDFRRHDGVRGGSGSRLVYGRAGRRDNGENAGAGDRQAAGGNRDIGCLRAEFSAAGTVCPARAAVAPRRSVRGFVPRRGVLGVAVCGIAGGGPRQGWKRRGALLCGDVAALPDWRGPALHQGWTPPEGLAQIAARRLQNADTDDFLSLVPLYVVAPSISTPKASIPESQYAESCAMTVLGRYLPFDQVAGDYDLTRVIPPAQTEEIVRRLGRETHLERGGLLLDAGVGTGRLAVPLAKLYPAQVIGADVSLPMMGRIAAKAAPDILSLTQADLQRLPFADGAFSGVLMVHILHLIERWPLVLAEAKRVLAPRSGVLFLGMERGGRSVLVDFYLERARARAGFRRKPRHGGPVSGPVAAAPPGA